MFYWHWSHSSNAELLTIMIAIRFWTRLPTTIDSNQFLAQSTTAAWPWHSMTPIIFNSTIILESTNRPGLLSLATLLKCVKIIWTLLCSTVSCLPVFCGHELDPTALEGEHKLPPLQLHNDAAAIQKISVTVIYSYSDTFPTGLNCSRTLTSGN